jgi:hydroxyethylthiazole kinase-like uncharacterized protein yjeF
MTAQPQAHAHPPHPIMPATAACPTRPRRHPLQVLAVPVSHPLALHGAVATRMIEAAALAAQPGGALMRRAGHAVAHWALAMTPHARRWWFAIGPGGNGGDGSFAAARLARLGLDVSLTVYADPMRLPQDAARGLDAARLAGVSIEPGPPANLPPDVVVDALLGIGAARAPEGPVLEGLMALSRCSVPCLSIDLPTGLDADSGRVHGPQTVSAFATLSLLTLKPGLFTGSGRRYAGEIWLEPLGHEAAFDLSPGAASPSAHLLCASDAQPTWSLRTQDQHKGHFGDAVVVGGAPGMPGAARLAAHAALAAGAGRTILIALDPSLPAGDPLRPEVMCRGLGALEDAAWLAQATVVCGCGGGDTIAAVLPKVLRHAQRLVLDADALNAVARDPALQQLMRGRSDAGLDTIMTPHPLEAARLLACTTADVQSDRLLAAARLAARFRCTIVLKGSGTVVSSPDLTPAINPTGGPALASGGTGDVLAGWIGGLWAQAPRFTASAHRVAHEAACAATWRHGHAAERAPGGVPATRALDLIETMRSPCPPDD